MNVDQILLEKKTRCAYERAKLLKALKILGLVIPFVICSAILSADFELCMLLGLALAICSVFFGWKGKALEKAVLPGIFAGTLASIPPLITSCCYSSQTLRANGFSCLLPCFFSGILAGCFVGWRLRTYQESSLTFWMAGGLLASITASLGCLPLGLSGVLAVVLTLPLATTTTSWLLPRPA